jgi:hypothetical protein
MARRLGVGELGSVAVGVLFVMTRRVITIPLRGTEAYLAEGEGICDGGESCAMAVAVWAAQDVLVEYAFK